MNPEPRLSEPSVAHARFEPDGELIESTPGFLTETSPEAYLAACEQIDGAPATAKAAANAAQRWRAGGAVVHVQTGGIGRVLSSHMLEDGSVMLVAADMATPLNPSHDLLSDVLGGLNEGCALFDEDSQLVVCNELFREMNSGVREFLHPGVHWETLLREMARRRIVRQASGREEAWVDQTLQASEANDPFEIERTDGTTTLVSPRPTANGGFIISEIDITARRRAEELANESEKLLSTLLEASPANLCMSQIGNGAVVYQSPASVDLFGRAESARDQFVDPLDRADFLTELLASDRIDDFPAKARRQDGSEFPALFSARIIDYRGEETMVSTVTDLTDMAAAEQTIKEASIRLRDAIEALNEGFILYDSDERVIMANQRFLEMNSPYAERITPGTHTRVLLEAASETGHILDAEGWIKDYEDELARGEAGSHRTFEFRMSDGTWVNSIRRPTRDGGFVITWLDVTDEKLATAELARLKDRLEDAIESLDAGFALYDDQDRLVTWNRRYGELNEALGDVIREGVTYREIIETAIATHQLDEDEARTARLSGQQTQDNKPLQFEFEDHSGRWFAVSRNPTSEGGFVITRSDITERKLAEAELGRQREMLHQSEKLSALGELLAGVAHELNNPLSVVVGHSLMLEEEIDDPSQLKRTRKISTAAERCSRIVKTFLAMARQRPTKLELTSVNSIADTALEVAGYGLRKAGVDVRSDFADDLPPVNADADQLVQVLANLVVNAEHALAPLGAEARLSISTRLSRSKKEVIIEVVDNGPGIPEKIRARIFEPFFTTKNVGEGTGIGLAFCHRVVATHDGTIQVGEAKGGGARFTIRLSAAQATSSVPTEPDATAPVLGRALVIDDEEDVADLISHILDRDGYQVSTVHSVEAALDRLPGDFDLILTDINMPGLDGRELLHTMRERWPGLDARLGFITGDTMSPSADQFLSEAGHPYLEKPITPTDLRALVARIVAHPRKAGS